MTKPASTKPSEDLEPAAVPQVNWAAGDKAEGLGTFFMLVTGQANEAIGWYYRSKNEKKWKGQTTRLLALLFATLAGILPSVAQMTTSSQVVVVPPGLATVALALAAALVALDRFYGYTSAWMRYVTTAQEIKQALDEFRFDWEVERVRWGGGTPDDDQTVQALTRLRAFLSQVNLLVRQETNSWVGEFRTSLQAIEEAAKARAEAGAQGGANVVVAGGDKATGGWTLKVDDDPPTTHHGTSAAINKLIPGLRTFTVEADIGGQRRQAQKVVTISSNAVTQVDLALG